MSDRLQDVLNCVNELEKLRRERETHPEEALGITVGELDWTAELHRLLGVRDACI
jgi:hypothetical protein